MVLAKEEHASAPSRFEDTRLVSVSRLCPNLDPTTIFHHSLGQERFYWADGRSSITYVGLGIAADLQAWGADRFSATAEQVTALYADAYLAAAESESTPAFAEPQLFGGFAFSQGFAPDNTWSIYHPAQFILPHYQIAVGKDETGQESIWLTMNVLIDVDEDASMIAEQLLEGLSTQIGNLQNAVAGKHQSNSDIESTNNGTEVASIEYPMSFQQWKTMINMALDEFAAERLQKVVLSRVCEIRFDKSVDVDSALSFLNNNYPDCTRFVFEPRPHHAFFGASPETLVRLDQGNVTTMGLAGSAPRGQTAAEDAVHGQGLLDSAKDQHEHAVVVDSIRRRLEPICAELTIADEPELLKLSNIQHLYTPIQAQLRDKQTVFDLVKLLHPTPALGGSPRGDALAFIDKHEPVPRGWYAAPVGIVNRKLDGTFCVAIRSAVAEYERVWLHAGAGIVAGSDPQMEWDETALKFRPILNALNVTESI